MFTPTDTHLHIHVGTYIISVNEITYSHVILLICPELSVIELF